MSWTGWAWRGRNGPSDNCTEGMTQCNTPDMRNNAADGRTGVLTDGTLGGANWTEVWRSFVSPPAGEPVVVQDMLPGVHLNATAYEPAGYLPRPCIVGEFIGNYCGYPLGTPVPNGDWNSMWNQSVFESVLPGLPPGGPPTACFQQTCPGFPPCNATAPIVPVPHPCG